MHPVIHAMLRHRDPRVRQKGRRLARHPSLIGQALIRELDEAIRQHESLRRPALRKDMGGAGPPTGTPAVSGDSFTPTAGRGRLPKRVRKPAQAQPQTPFR